MNPSRATIPLIRPHQCDSEGGRIRGVLLYSVLQCLVIASYCSVSLIMSATSSAKKRKVDIERRAFNPAWKEKYFLWSALDNPVPHMLEDCGRS